MPEQSGRPVAAPSRIVEAGNRNKEGAEGARSGRGGSGDVITIDSDEEEDQRVASEARVVRLMPDGRLGRARDFMNRFVNENGSNRALDEMAVARGTDGSAVAQTGDNNNTADDDDDDALEIISAVDHRDNAEGPIYPETAFVNLDDEPESVSHGSPNGVIMIDHSGSNGGGSADNNNNEEDDGIEIVRETTTNPHVILNLPGGHQLQIDANSLDRPMRSSFEWQEDMPASRRRLLRRSARTARRIGRTLFHESSSGDEANEDANESLARARVPIAVSRLRRQQMMRMQEIERRQRLRAQQLANQDNESGASSALGDMGELRTQIQSYPEGVRDAFDRAQSLHEFRSILQEIAPVTLRECGEELTVLYSRYRSRIMESWAAERVRQARQNLSRVQGTQRPGIRSTQPARGPGGSLASVLSRIAVEHNARVAMPYDGQEEDEDPYDEDYNAFRNAMFPYDDGYGSDAERREQERTQNIINMIQRREELERDARVKSNMEKTKSMEDKFQERARELPEGYNADFDSTPKMQLQIVKDGKEEHVVVDDDDAMETEMDVPSCTLCGVELGVGIPDSFTGISEGDQGVSFEYLVDEYGYHCPYQSLLRPQQLDRDLSRRTYIANCGHTFCGRCYVRVENAKTRSKGARKDLAKLTGSSHPDNYGPRRCPAEGCKGLLRNKSRMREMYL